MLVSVGKSWTCFALTSLMPGLSTSAYSTNWEVIFTSVLFLSVSEILTYRFIWGGLYMLYREDYCFSKRRGGIVIDVDAVLIRIGLIFLLFLYVEWFMFV